MAKKKKAATKKIVSKVKKNARGANQSGGHLKSPTTVRPGRRVSWLDATSHTPLIESYARRLKGFMDALADGKVDETEVREQESRLVTLMKEIEPQLDAAMHAKITQLLCELTAYDLMQILHSMEAARPKTTFRG
jgi:hypothetical protein